MFLPPAVEPKFITRILLAVAPPDFTKGARERSITLHYFTRILLAAVRKKERKMGKEQEPASYQVYSLRHG